jgi:DNA repair protein RecO (recombination protein O)
MLQKTTGIVLHSLKYNDTSNIVDIYTELYGRTSFLIPVSRSRKAAVKPVFFQPLSMIELDADFRASSSLYRIKEVKAYPFGSIPYHPYKSAIALFLAEFLYRTVKEEGENRPLFAYLRYSIEWLDRCEDDFANYHLVFLIHLTRFLGLYPNLDDYRQGDYFDLLNAGFTSLRPYKHSFYVNPEESFRLTRLIRMNYDTMHLFGMNRTNRMRCLTIICDYYRLHIPGFRDLRSLPVLQELFD